MREALKAWQEQKSDVDVCLRSTTLGRAGRVSANAFSQVDWIHVCCAFEVLCVAFAHSRVSKGPKVQEKKPA